jgi:hypothetical protein
MNFHPVPHGVTVSCERYTMGFPVCNGSQKHHECKEDERGGRWLHVTLHVQTCSGRNRIIPLMRRPSTGSAPNTPVTLPRYQLLIRYVVMSPVHTAKIRCYGTRLRYKCVPTSGLHMAGLLSPVPALIRSEQSWRICLARVSSYFTMSGGKISWILC